MQPLENGQVLARLKKPAGPRGDGRPRQSHGRAAGRRVAVARKLNPVKGVGGSGSYSAPPAHATLSKVVDKVPHFRCIRVSA